jgi:hypothetical protein
MVRDVGERITEFLLKGEEQILINREDDKLSFELDEENIDEYFQIKALALNMNQIRRYTPPPNPAKITDPRAGWYIRNYGNKSWELDALKPEVLRSIAEQGIIDFIDVERYNKWINLEIEQKKKLQEFGESLANKE